jgi:hypothetical protein
MTMIASRISDLGMQTGNPSAGLLPVGIIPGLSGQGSQLPAECGQFFLKVAGIGDMLTVAGGQKGFDANVRADRRNVASQPSLARQRAAHHLLHHSNAIYPENNWTTL